MSARPSRLLETHFLALVERVAPKLFGSDARIDRDVRVGTGSRVDLLVTYPSGRVAIVEVKADAPATATRLSAMRAQLEHYRREFSSTGYDFDRIDLVLIVPGALLGPLSRRQLVPDLVTSRLRVIDGPALRHIAPEVDWPDGVARALDHPPCAVESDLTHRLRATPSGKSHWSSYQRLVRDILALTLCPPLEEPIDESGNESGTNRRDMVLPNYASDGFWRFARDHYQAYYVVVEAKNFVGQVKKNQVLQVANYSSAPGTGMFGLLICRTAGDRSANMTRREQWVLHQKLILVLNDDDLEQMLALRCAGDDPSAVIRQKVEDFRLAY